MRPQRESCVYIVYLCREIVANYSRTSLQLSHSSEIGALGTEYCQTQMCSGLKEAVWPNRWTPSYKHNEDDILINFERDTDPDRIF